MLLVSVSLHSFGTVKHHTTLWAIKVLVDVGAAFEDVWLQLLWRSVWWVLQMAFFIAATFFTVLMLLVGWFEV